MRHDLARVSTAFRVEDGVDAEGDEAAAMHDALVDCRLDEVLVVHARSIGGYAPRDPGGAPAQTPS